MRIHEMDVEKEGWLQVREQLGDLPAHPGCPGLELADETDVLRVAAIKTKSLSAVGIGDKGDGLHTPFREQFRQKRNLRRQRIVAIHCAMPLRIEARQQRRHR